MKKKLLHIVLWLDYGGLEKIVYDFSRELNSKDYEVHVAALEKGTLAFHRLPVRHLTGLWSRWS